MLHGLKGYFHFAEGREISLEVNGDQCSVLKAS